MTLIPKYWTKLGVGMLAVGGVSACGPSDRTAEKSNVPPVHSVGAELGEGGELGEQGESGEGGIDFEVAATDPVVYNQALAITEAHVRAAQDAYRAGETAAAAEMFAHPVSEVLFDMQDVFEAQGVKDFTQLLLDASTAALASEDADKISERSEAIIATLKSAARKAPEDSRTQSVIAAGVISDQIDRAVRMYREAGSSERYEPYLDGYGFYQTAVATYERYNEGIASENAEVSNNIEASLVLLRGAYPSAERGVPIDKDQSALSASSSVLILSLP